MGGARCDRRGSIRRLPRLARECLSLCVRCDLRNVVERDNARDPSCGMAELLLAGARAVVMSSDLVVCASTEDG